MVDLSNSKTTYAAPVVSLIRQGRRSKSTTHQDFNDTTTKVQHYCAYAQGALNYCVNQPKTPEADGGPGLGLNDKDVLQATPADVINEYTDFQIQTAETHNRVMSLVAMIPCIQVYVGQFCPRLKADGLSLSSLTTVLQSHCTIMLLIRSRVHHLPLGCYTSY